MPSRYILGFSAVAAVLGTCGTSARAEAVYFTNPYGHEIKRTNHNGTVVVDVIPAVLQDPNRIALDSASEKIYWTERELGEIKRANLDGTNIEVVLTGLDWPRAIALDEANGRVYWTSFDRIQRADLDGTVVEDVLTDLEDLRAIAIDPTTGTLYWSDVDPIWYESRISAASLDGHNPHDLVSLDSQPTHEIVIDPLEGKIYWAAHNRIFRANLDGSSVEWLPTGYVDPAGITLDLAAGKMYWTEFGTGDIRRANLDGTAVETVIAFALGDPMGIAFSPTLQKLYWADNREDKIQRANLDGSLIENVIENLLNVPQGIAVDAPAGKVYWADHRGIIGRANLDGSEMEDLFVEDNAGIRDITLDTTGGKMYWSNSRSKSIHRANLDGTDLEGIVTGLDGPIGITVDSEGGKVYWADGVPGVSDRVIRRANLDGTSVEDLVATGPIGGIAVDHPSGKMYWPDTERVMRANLDGSEIEEAFTSDGPIGSPRGIALDLIAGRIYWVGRSDFITSVNLDGTDYQRIAPQSGRLWGIALDPRESVQASLDVKPGSCPNTVNVRSRGIVPMAVAGTDTFTGSDVDADSVRLSRTDRLPLTLVPSAKGRATPYSVEDVTSPFDLESCDCLELASDGIDDFVLKFRTPELVNRFRLNWEPQGTAVEVIVHGFLRDGRSFEASNCIMVNDPGRPSPRGSNRNQAKR